MKIRTFGMLTLIVAAVTAPLTGQVAYVLRTPGPNVTDAFYLPSAQYPTGLGVGGAYVPSYPLPFFFGGGPIPPGTPGEGGHTIITAGAQTRMISSDGLQIWEEAHPLYGGPPPLPPVPVPVLTSPNYRLSGLGADNGGGFVWMCDAFSFRKFNSAWPYGAVGGVITPAFPHSQFTGITWEPSTNSLWLCDIQGCIYNCDFLGAPIGGQPVACLPGSLIGIAANSTTGPFTLAPPACSTQVAGFRIITTDGIQLFDALSGAAVPLGGAPMGYGLAFSPDGQASHGGTPWWGSGVKPTISTAHPLTNLPGNQCRISGAMPGAPAELLFAPCPLPGLGWALCSGYVRQWGSRLPTTIDGTGRAFITIPPALPPGFQVTAQWAFYDPLQCGNTCLTDALTVTFGTW